MEALLKIELAGPARVVDARGKDFTPGLMRAKAIIAMLAMAPDNRRSRAWLKDKLWSDRTPSEAAAALRYALWSLRKGFGPYRHILITKRDWVGIDAGLVEIETPCFQTEAELTVFAEGLDVDAPEFEDWLRETRAGFDRQCALGSTPAPLMLKPAEKLRHLLHIEVRCDGSAPGRPEQLARAVAGRVSQTSQAVVRLGAPAKTDFNGFGRVLSLEIDLASVHGRAIAQVTVLDARRHEILWTNARDMEAPSRGHDPAHPFANLIAQVVARQFSRTPADASDAERVTAATCQALSWPENFSGTVLAESVDWLGRLEIEDAMPLAMARRALYLGWQVIERGTPDPTAALEEARDLSRLAIERDPSLAETYAIRSELADFDRNHVLARTLAEHAMRLDKYNPVVMAAWAKTSGRIGQSKEAYQRATIAQRLSAGSANPAWWAMLCCTMALNAGNIERARRHAEVAHDLDPSFLPPLRFLAVLNFATKDFYGARRALHRLSQREPDFSLRNFADPSYPLRSIRPNLLNAIARSNIM